MDTHSAAQVEHSHPTPGLYLKIAVVLFVLTALEVLTFEGGRGGLGPALQPIFEPIVVLILVVFSGAKFILVAMFYMHLKQDPKLLSNLFLWPLVIAAVIIASLIVLLSYWRVVGGMASPNAALH
jgi:cytochrome c oxidase subunit 4